MTKLTDKVKKDQGVTASKMEARELAKKYKEALKLVERAEHERDLALDIKHRGVNTFEIKPKLTSSGSEGTAVWVASDWHVGEKVTLGQTNGINEYNPEIAKERGIAFFRNGMRLTQIFSKDIEIKQIVLALLGD